MKKDHLKNYLQAVCVGRTHRMTSQELEHELGLSGTQLRELVNQLRKDRIPIASDRYGYFYASTAGEVYETIRFLQRIDAGLQATIRGLEESLHEIGTKGGHANG